MAAGQAGDLKRRARRDYVQRSLRVELIGQWKQVELVGAASVVQHEQPARLAGGGSLGVHEARHSRQG